MNEIVKNFFKKIRNIASDELFRLQISVRGFPSRIHYDVSAKTQFASSDLVEDFIRGKRDATADLRWKETGADSPEEYAKWAWSACGMACFAMALEYFTGEKHKIVDLGKGALQVDVYKDEGETFSAMYYRPFKTWVEREFTIRAAVKGRLDIRGIQKALSRGGLVIASVNPNIREAYHSAPEDQKGGHLVLVTGYDGEKELFYINNPSGFASNKSQKDYKISFESFKKLFAGRGLILRLK